MKLGCRAARRAISLNVQYTLGQSKGNTAGSNEALTSGNLARRLSDFDYDDGYNNFDVRHTFNLSLLYPIPYGRGRAFGATIAVAQALLGGWDIGGIVNGRSGTPVNVIIVRPDVVYRDAAGNVFTNPAADRVAIINTPGGGNSRNVRRPNLVPGVSPFLNQDGVLFLNPAAFSTPAPGTYGDLERKSIHGPISSRWISSSRSISHGADRHGIPRRDLQPVDTVNFANPVGTLPLALPRRARPRRTACSRAAISCAAAAARSGADGHRGTNGRARHGRQIQFALRVQLLTQAGKAGPNGPALLSYAIVGRA